MPDARYVYHFNHDQLTLTHGNRAIITRVRITTNIGDYIERDAAIQLEAKAAVDDDGLDEEKD